MLASPVAIVVDADLAELRKTEQALEHVGFVVMSAGSFAQAKALLVSITPEIVIADIKLEAFNGLHLAALCAVWRPATPFIATHSVYDTVLEADAKRLSASYVVKTSTREELTRLAVELLTTTRHGHEVVRRSHRKLASPPTRQPEEKLPEAFDIVFPEQDFSLHAARIWAAHDSQTGGWLCGAD